MYKIIFMLILQALLIAGYYYFNSMIFLILNQLLIALYITLTDNDDDGMVYGNVKVKPYIEIEAPKVVYGTIPKKYSIDNKTKVYEDMLTLEDYKLLLKLLKEQKKNKVKEEIQPDLTELDNLFRSIK